MRLSGADNEIVIQERLKESDWWSLERRTEDVAIPVQRLLGVKLYKGA